MSAKDATTADPTEAACEVPATFPFQYVRPGQRDFLKDAVDAVSAGKHLLAQAPTGLGKTAVGLAASLEVAIRENKLVLFLTSRQSQHRIVIDTLRRVRSRGLDVAAVDVVSKLAMCPQANRPRNARAFNEYCGLMTRTRSCRFFNRETDATVRLVLENALHVQEMQQTCSKHGVCPYKVALDAATRAHVLVCDYNYIFSELRERVLPRLGRKLPDLILVIDEAHNLPDRIRSQLCGTLSPRQLLNASKDAKEGDRQLARTLYAMGRVLDCQLDKVRVERRAEKRLVMDILEQVSPGGPWSSDTVAASAMKVGEDLAGKGRSTSLPEIAAFLKAWNGSGSWIVRTVRGGEERCLAYRLLDASILSRDVFRSVHSSILMSGTLHPGEMYVDLLGLERERVVLRTYPSPFPPGNRLTVVTPHLTTLYDKRTDSMMQAMANEVAGISRECPGNMAAFFPSYGILAKIAEKLRDVPVEKHMIVERPEWDKAKRDMVILRMRELRAKEGALLFGVLGGSFSEGIDYNDNLLSCVIVGGLPISPPTAEIRALEDYFATKFGGEKGYRYAFVFPAINKVLQAAGRCIRSEKDRAVVAIFDNRLLSSNYSSCFPPGFDAKPSDDVSSEVRTFFYGATHRQRRDSQTGSGSGAEALDVARAGGRGEAPRAEEVPEPAA